MLWNGMFSVASHWSCNKWSSHWFDVEIDGPKTIGCISYSKSSFRLEWLHRQGWYDMSTGRICAEGSQRLCWSYLLYRQASWMKHIKKVCINKSILQNRRSLACSLNAKGLFINTPQVRTQERLTWPKHNKKKTCISRSKLWKLRTLTWQEQDKKLCINILKQWKVNS